MGTPYRIVLPRFAETHTHYRLLCWAQLRVTIIPEICSDTLGLKWLFKTVFHAYLLVFGALFGTYLAVWILRCQHDLQQLAVTAWHFPETVVVVRPVCCCSTIMRASSIRIAFLCGDGILRSRGVIFCLTFSLGRGYLRVECVTMPK
jgi:hypothetical protein